MRIALIFLCTSLSAQIFPSTDTGTVVMSCGGRPAWVSPSQIVADASTYPTGYPNAQPPLCTQALKTSSPGTYPIWDVNLLTQSASGGWSGHPTEVNITSALKGNLLPQNASAGNPDSDGTNLVFIAQTSSNAANNVSPGVGTGYAIVLCNTLSPGTGSGTCCFNGGSSSGSCGTTFAALTSSGASLDPHIDGYGAAGGISHVFWVERNPVQTTSNSSCFATNIVPWVEHYATVNWGTPGTTAPTVTADQQWCPESMYFTTLLSTIATSSDTCDQYYKATSVVHQPNGTTTMYTQANQVQAYNVYSTGTGTPSCELLGLGAPADGVENAGIMSFTMTSPPTGTTATATMIWPPVGFTGTQCLTPSTLTYPTRYPHCYAEFPLSQNGQFMAMDSGYLVPTATIQLCGSQTSPFGSCTVHQLTEISQFNLLDGKSYQPLTDIQELGTTLQTTWMPSGLCASGFPCYYGGFSHYSMLGSSLSGPNLAVNFQSSQVFGFPPLNYTEVVLFNMIYAANYWGNWMVGGGATINNLNTGGRVRW